MEHKGVRAQQDLRRHQSGGEIASGDRISSGSRWNLVELQRSAGNHAVAQLLTATVQRTFTVGPDVIGDVATARARAPVIPGLEREYVESYVAAEFPSNRVFGDQAAWEADIRAAHVLPDNRRVGVLGMVMREEPGGYTFTWTDARRGYRVSPPAGGPAPPQPVWLLVDWSDDIGYAALSAPTTVGPDIEYTLTVPRHLWPRTTNQRNSHGVFVALPALSELVTKVDAYRGAAGALGPRGVVPLPPAVFDVHAHLPLESNDADRAAVQRTMTAARRLEILLAACAQADTPINRDKVAAERVRLRPLLDALALGAGHPARFDAIGVFRDLSAGLGFSASRIDVVVSELLDPLMGPQVAAATLAHAAAVAAAGRPRLPGFGSDRVISDDVIAHIAVAHPRRPADFESLGIGGGHVIAELMAFVNSHREYDLQVREEGAGFTSYDQYLWRGLPTAIAERENTRPSEGGHPDDRAFWVEADVPKTSADDVGTFLADAEDSYHTWQTAHQPEVDAIANGSKILARFRSVAFTGMGYEAYVARDVSGVLRLTTVYPLLG